MVEKEKHLSVAARIDAIHEIEAFVEKICDDYNIFHSYYGNILYSVSQAFEFAIERTGKKRKHVDIWFESRPHGLVFKIFLGDRFLEIAAFFEKDPEEELKSDHLSETEKALLTIRMLSDEINFNAEEETMEMVFYISSINEHLTQDRIKLLDQYFENLKVKKPTT